MKVGFLHQLYATRADMEPGLRRIELSLPLEFIQTGLFDDEQVTRYRSAFDLPHLGESLTGENVHDPKYIVAPAGTKIIAHPIPQRRGGVKYVVDQQENPSSNILFRPSGIYRGQALIAGQLGTPLKDPISMELFRTFYHELFQGFVKVKTNYVGPEALDLLKRGFRLTQSFKSPGQLILDSTSPVPPTAPGVWGKDTPEVIAMRYPDVS